MVITLVLIYFGTPQLGDTTKTNFITFQTVGDMLNFLFLWKGLGLAYPPYFVYDLSRKVFPMLFYELPKYLLPVQKYSHRRQSIKEWTK